MNAVDRDHVLVPFADRMRGLALTRGVLALAVVVAAGAGALGRDASVLEVGVLTVAFLLLTAPALRAHRVRRSLGIAVVGAALLVDGLYLAAVTYAAVGFATPVSVVVVLHCVGVTLLASFRTGLKLALWHTLLIMSTHELHLAGVLSLPGAGWRPVLVLVASLWLVTFATASFAAVNEREIRRRNYDLDALSRLSLELEASLSPADVGAALIDAVCDDQGSRRAVLLGAVGERLERIAGRGDELVADDGPRPSDDVMVGRAAAEHRTVRVARLDPARDPWLLAALPGAVNVVLVPVYADGVATAVLVAEQGAASDRMTLRAQRMLERYASHAGLALTNARLLEGMRRLADTDGLTGVANRRTFDLALTERLHRAAAERTAISVVLVDLDHFKRLNDTLGHQAGDEVLRDVGRALTTACRPSDLVARYGGEEFAVIMPGAAAADAAATADRLRRAVAASTAAGPAGSVTASLGVAVAPEGEASAQELVALADQALYRSKDEGRDRVTTHVVAPRAAVAG